MWRKGTWRVLSKLAATARGSRERCSRMDPPRNMLDQLPVLKLDHLHRLTDDTGMLQHATFAVPNYSEGYTTDDNARALLLTVLIEQLGGSRVSGNRKTRFAVPGISGACIQSGKRRGSGIS